MENKSSNVVGRLKERYGLAGLFLFSVIATISYLKADNFFGLVNMYLVMTPDEMKKVIFSIITFDMVSSLALALFGGLGIFFFVSSKEKALVYAFAFLVLQPAVDTIIEIGYSGQVTRGIWALVGGALIFWFFWHFLGDKAVSYFKLNYMKFLGYFM